MAFGRIISVMYDVMQQSYLNPDTGSVLAINPGMSFLERVILQVSYVNGAINVPLGVTSYVTATGNVDNAFNDPAGLVVQTLTAGINVAGDWPAGGNPTGGNADATLGEFSIRLDGNTVNALTKLGSSAALNNSRFELLVFDNTGDLIFSQRIPFTFSNLQDTSGGTTPIAAGQTFLNADQIKATYVPQIGSPGQSYLLVSPDGNSAVQVSCDNTGHISFATILPYVP